MSRTYWAPKGQDLEFLGAYQDGHVAKPNTPQAAGRIIDVTDLDMLQVMERLKVETRPAPPLLVGLPAAIAKRLQARMPVAVPWAQIEGYVR
jgi:hypothetical protein